MLIDRMYVLAFCLLFCRRKKKKGKTGKKGIAAKDKRKKKKKKKTKKDPKLKDRHAPCVIDAHSSLSVSVLVLIDVSLG